MHARRWGGLDLVFLVALVTGTVLRAYVALDPVLGRLNSDQAVDYLQARHVLDGEYQAYFWGQQYAGSLLPTVMGWTFAVIGPQLWLLPVLLIAFSTAAVVLTRAVGVALGRPDAGNVAGALMAVGPPTWVFLGSVSASFYSVGMALSLASLLVVLRSGPTPSLRQGGLAGLLAGLAFWVSPLSLLTLIPTVVLALRPFLRHPPALGAAVGGALLGLLPMIGAAVLRGQLTADRFLSPATVENRAEQAVTGTWVSVFTRFAPREVPPWLLDRVASAALLAAVVAAGVLAVRALRGTTRGPDLALLLPVLLFVPLAVYLRLPSDAPASRYAVPVLPFLALVAATRLRRQYWQVGVVVGLALFSVVGLGQAAAGPRLGTDPLHSPSYAALTSELLARGRTAVRADYWVSYRLAAESDERVVADPPTMTRYRPYAVAADRAPQSTFVVFAGGPSDVAMLEFFAGTAGIERVQLAQFAIYYADRRLTGPELPPFRPTFDVPDP